MRKKRRRRIGILGGTFDPLHNGHLILGRRAIESFSLDTVLLVPAAQSPLKSRRPPEVSGEYRLEMVRRAAAFDRRFAVWDGEIRRGAPSYTIDTIRELERENPDADFFLIVGQDAFASLDQWKDGDELRRRVSFLVMNRPGTEQDDANGIGGFARRDCGETDERSRREGREQRGVHKLKGPLIEISSSRIRQYLRQCDSVRGWVPDGVLSLIEYYGFYATEEEPEGLRRHRTEVAAAAAALAQRWGASAALAARAGWLHDAYRALDSRIVLSLLESRGEVVDEVERNAPILLHGRLAASRIEANRLGPRDDRVAEAVRYHTTGRSGMSVLETILFVADRVGKDWPDVEAVPEDRGTAVRAVFERKIAILRERNLRPHPRLLEGAREWGVKEDIISGIAAGW